MDVMWLPEVACGCRVWLWLHPSALEEVTLALKQVFALVDHSNNAQDTSSPSQQDKDQEMETEDNTNDDDDDDDDVMENSIDDNVSKVGSEYRTKKRRFDCLAQRLTKQNISADYVNNQTGVELLSLKDSLNRFVNKNLFVLYSVTFSFLLTEA